MSTATVSNPVAAQPGRGPTRTSKAKPRFIVTLNGVPCEKRPVPKLFGSKMAPKSGTLVKNDRNPSTFAGEKSAQKAIGRAIRLRNQLTSAVFQLPDAYKPFAEPGDFKVVVQI